MSAVNSSRWWLLLLIILAVTTRIAAAIAIGSGFHFADEAIYFDAARRLSEGRGFEPGYQQAPGYPVFLVLLSLGLPWGLESLRVCQSIVSGLGTAVVVHLAERMFGRTTAIAAGLTYALDPLLVIASALLYPEAIAAVLLPYVVLLVWGATERDSLRHSAFTGALLGLLAQLRPVALILPPIVAAWLACTAGGRARRRVAHLGALGVTFLLVLAPWTARNYRVHGRLVPVAIAGIQTAPVTEVEAENEGLVPAMARWAWHDPASLVSRVFRQFLQFWELAPTRLTTDNAAQREELHLRDPRLEVNSLFSRKLRDSVSTVASFLELLLALIGIIVVRSRWRATLLLLSVIFAWAIGYALFVAKIRYRIPVLPLVFLFTGAGAATVWSFLRRFSAGRR